MGQLRKNARQEFTWDLSCLFPHLDAFEKACRELQNEAETGFGSIQQFRHQLGQKLPLGLTAYFSFMRRIDALYTYAHLLHDQDVKETRPMEIYKRALQIYENFQTETAWLEPEILAIPDEQFSRLLSQSELSPFLPYLKKLQCLKPHTLTDKEEKLLAMAQTPLKAASKAFSLMNNADMKFQPAIDVNGHAHELTHGSYAKLMKSEDRVLRKSAFTHLHQKFSEYENTLSELLNGCVQNHLFSAKARGYPSCLDAALFPHQIDPAVYHQLIDTLSSHLKPLERYLKLRKSCLGVDELHAYDLSVPIVEDADTHFEYEDAVDIVLDSYRPLGDEYVAIVAQGLKKDRWVDVYENEGKRSGAYSSGCYDSFPYILLNYQATFSDVMTLSHEIGHSMHSYYSCRNQPYQSSSYAIFVAEVASTFNEELTFRKLLELAKTPKQRCYILSQKIDSIRSTLYRQTLFAEFELVIHQMAEKQIPMTPHALKELYLNLNTKYYGKVMTIDSLLAVECLRIPHFYYNFYVYQYATGISAAYFLAEKVLAGEARALENYLQFLKSGSSQFPLELLQRAGVDMFKKEPIVHLIDRFSFLVDALEEELKKI